MNPRYLIVDDDPACRRMLIQIIEDSRLGEVIDVAEDGNEAERKILHLKPDIVVIDLLMPGQDGVEAIRNLIEKGYNGHFVMISQIENKEMVEQAYIAGVNFFIHKPINRVEVRSVLQQIRDTFKMQSSLQSIRQHLEQLVPQKNESALQSDTSDHFLNAVQNILYEMGIMGEAGSNDLIKVMKFLYQKQIRSGDDFPTIKEIYYQVVSQSSHTEEQTRKEIKAMEQRIRRVIDHALSHLASIGLTDFSHPKFEHYAPRFFDFSEVRKKMKEIDNKGESTGKKAKINVKKFIQILYWEAFHRINIIHE
ncbi:MAG: response regulator [Bacillaceae bacterium]|nr:response regulator [Bacillaceae bacterium]